MVDDLNNDAPVGTVDAPEEAVEPVEAVVEPPVVATDSAKLVVKRGGVETDVEYPIVGSAVIGRFDPAVGPIDVDLGAQPEGVYVSRKHAKISLEDGIWKIRDLGSANGTFLLKSDFEKVDEAELADGQEIALGNARLVFHLG